ncbi:MAG: phosphoglycerate kinase [Alphaproteobacteria bacterium]|nr:phosphoglycerate kinase [Alphaproteobacteria bacterium]
MFPIITSVVDILGKVVLVRASLDVPVVRGKVIDTLRLDASIASIDWLQKAGARVIVIGHAGRFNETKKISLEPMSNYLKKYIPHRFISSHIVDPKSIKIGEVVLLENLRTDAREEKGSIDFAKELVQGVDMYVYDDIATAHRKHTSTYTMIGMVPTYAGISFSKEIESFEKITKNKKSPTLAIIGGAKLETKLVLLKKMLSSYDYVYVGGIMANTLLQAKGYSVGASVVELVSHETDDMQYILKAQNLILPTTVRVQYGLWNLFKKNVSIDHVPDGSVIVDIPHKAIQKDIGVYIAQAKTIVWNGPLGWYEKNAFAGTCFLAKAIHSAKVFSVVGGGDTTAVLKRHNMLSYFSHVSIAGGAMFEYITKGTFPMLEK